MIHHLKNYEYKIMGRLYKMIKKGISEEIYALVEYARKEGVNMERINRIVEHTSKTIERKDEEIKQIEEEIKRNNGEIKQLNEKIKQNDKNHTTTNN